MPNVETTKFVDDQLRALGYRAKMLDETSVSSTAAGLNFYIHSYGESIQFRCVFDLDKKVQNWLEFANAFNTLARFVKAYVDEEQIYIEADWWLDLEGEERVKSFKESVEMWEVLLSEFKQKLRDKFKSMSS